MNKEKVSMKLSVWFGIRLIVFSFFMMNLPMGAGADTYTVTPLLSTYENEQSSCAPHGNIWTLCPPYVLYFNAMQSKTLEITVDRANNVLLDSQGNLFDTSDADPGNSGGGSGPIAIFVMDANGTIYASKVHKPLFLYHSSLLSGAAVASAGEMSVKDGVVKVINNCSGHYQPPTNIFTQIMSSLRQQGYKFEKGFLPDAAC